MKKVEREKKKESREGGKEKKVKKKIKEYQNNVSKQSFKDVTIRIEVFYRHLIHVCV